jgi:hypothetical protein
MLSPFFWNLIQNLAIHFKLKFSKIWQPENNKKIHHFEKSIHYEKKKAGLHSNYTATKRFRYYVESIF